MMRKVLFTILLIFNFALLFAQQDTATYWLEDAAPPKAVPQKTKKIIAWYFVYTLTKDTITSKAFEWNFNNGSLIETVDYTKEEKAQIVPNSSKAKLLERQLKNQKYQDSDSYDTLFGENKKPLRYFQTRKRTNSEGKMIWLKKDTSYLEYNDLGQIIKNERIVWWKSWQKDKNKYEFEKNTYTTTYSYDKFGNLSSKERINHQYEDHNESYWYYSYDDKNRLTSHYENVPPQSTSTKITYQENKAVVKQTLVDGSHPPVDTFYYEFVFKSGLLIRKLKYHPFSKRLYAWIDYQYIY